ncbi:MAG: hypothetical protein CJBNEKGG_01736 [Prosthecobacter sp.]|nr:hypothetical protein [Prosthecobacter sp.]
MTATSDDMKEIQGRARAWVQVLHLPFRQQRWRGQAGGFLGLGTGSSLEFQDHRAYVPGDDPRQINWQAYARTGSYTMKVHREEVRPQVDVLLDASASMSAYPTKRQRTLELLAFVLEAAFSAGASVRAFAVRGPAHAVLETDALCSGRWFEALERMPAEGVAEPPALSRLPLRAGSMRVLVSDLLFPSAPEPLLAELVRSQGRGIVFVPHCSAESAPGWQGNHEFVDAETLLPQEHRVEPDVLKGYMEAYARHFDLWKAAALKLGAALVRVDAEAAFLDAMRAEGVACHAVEVA